MEKNIVIIDRTDYDMVLNELNVAKRNYNEKYDQLERLRERLSILEDKVNDRIYEDSLYDLKDLDNTEGKNIIGDYRYQAIFNRYKQFGYDSLDYINDQINLLLMRYEKENENKEEE